MPDDVQLSMEPIGEAQFGSSPRGGVPPWVAVVSIVIGVLGLLCWGGMGIMSVAASSLVDSPEGTLEPSAGHQMFEAASCECDTRMCNRQCAIHLRVIIRCASF